MDKHCHCSIIKPIIHTSLSCSDALRRRESTILRVRLGCFKEEKTLSCVLRNKQDFSRWTYKDGVGRSSREKEKTYAFLLGWEEGWSGMHLWIKGYLSWDLEDAYMLVKLKAEYWGERTFLSTETSTYKWLQGGKNEYQVWGTEKHSE